VTVREALLHPRVLQGDAAVREAAELLARPSVQSVLVVDGERLLGCVTREAIVAGAAEGRDLRQLTVRDLCDPDVATVGPDTPLEAALHLMAEEDLERLAVTEDGLLLGVLPREPLVRRLAEDEPPPAENEPSP
jgi:predicted transcriptional regulator